MKINTLYCFWGVLVCVGIWLVYDFSNTAPFELFGTAETEGQILNYDYPILIRHIKVKTGHSVRKGDTLLVFSRPELEQQTVLKSGEWNVNEAAKTASSEDVSSEIEKLRSEHASKVSQMRTEIKILSAEDKAQAALRGLVTGEKSAKTLAAHKIQLLQQAVQSEEHRYQKLLSQLRTQQMATASVHDAKLDAVQQEIDRIDSAQQKLVLRAPIDGFIETIFVFENETADKFKSILKINPKLPDKVKGFLPEASQTLYRIGDTVLLRSAVRSAVTTSGVLIGATPQLVELPLRLRKLQEVKAWGREIYIQLPPKNDFFIGEKILISLERKKRNSL